MSAASEEPVGVQVCGKCHQVRRESALVLVDGEYQCAQPCKHPGGRPPIGKPVMVRMPAGLRDAVEELARPGETLAATIRRLLTDAVTAAETGAGPVRPRDNAGTYEGGGPRIVLAETWRGESVAVGPVYTDKGAGEIRAQIAKEQAGWTANGVIRIITKAQLPWSWES